MHLFQAFHKWPFIGVNAISRAVQPQTNTDHMKNKRRKIWFHDSILINCSINIVKQSLNNLGGHYKRIISVMPGMNTVELLEHGSDHVTIKTNEGIMKRTNISVIAKKDEIIIEFDEEYKAGKAITSNAHFVEKFDVSDNNLVLHIEISNLKAPGFLGFFYRNFGSKNIGSAFLGSYKKILEG